MWGKAKDRKNCAVLPDGEGIYRGVDKYVPQSRRPSASAGIRWSSPRTWIWLLLVANLFVVLMFVFVSAYYFPNADTPEVLLHHPPLNHESLIARHSVTSLRPALKSPRLDQEPLQDERVEGDQHQEELASAPMQFDAKLTDAVQEAESEPAVEDGQTKVARQESTALPVDANSIFEEAAAMEQAVETDTNPKIQDEGEPVKKRGSEETENRKLPSHIAGMLARVKATQEVAKQEQKSGEATLDGGSVLDTLDGVDIDRSRSFRSRSDEEAQETSQPALHQFLFVWLKADEGVELVDREACMQSQNPDECEVTSWTNQIRSTNALVPTAFKPASLLRPVWVPKATADGSGLPTVAFSCPLKAKHASFPESMTLFFVLSPTDIEEGDSYAGQKFFGSSPYGQFALHGGKPAFFGSTGLIESNEALQRSHSSILVYRLQRHSVEIRAQDRAWTPLPSESRLIRLSQNAEISLGNAKPVCDTNAFRGHISEVMLYSVALDDARVEEVEKYLQSRYAVPVDATERTEQELGQRTGQDGEQTPAAAEQLPDATVVDKTDDDSLATGDKVDTESPQQEQQAQEVNTNGQDQPESPDDYNPELVFEWVPSKELLDAKGLSSAVAEQWTSAVREKIQMIQTFQLGGEVLREFIHEQKKELLRLHDDLFRYSSPE